ncbi:MAG: YggS family pyridoxal phosphate-dependent enzyme [Symbiobacterium sp.]|uniref:YggS family pyridoxal phosphate-dependent enzyme n=1 Tax=Symbiobacterium sp. TaxID=1971213 RepID=UPI0034645BCF
MSNIKENIGLIQEQIRQAALRAGRDPAGVKLIAVSKTRTVAEIEEALACGIRDFGENRVQELRSKAPLLAEEGPTWHLIGTLQTNKVKQALEWAELIHSLDRVSLLEELVKQAERRGRPCDVLVQVNVSGEATKHGLAPGDLEPFLRRVAQQRWVRVRGLMTMAPYSPDPEQARPYFRRLRELRDQMRALGLEGVSMEHLSMGMSGDFVVGVEEGATMVRVGTAIFGPRD